MKFSAALFTGLLATSATAFRMDVWQNKNYQGTQRAYIATGTHKIGFLAHSYIWTSPVGDGCCAVFCRGSSNVGKWCDGHSNSNVASGIDKVVLGCGSDVLNC